MKRVLILAADAQCRGSLGHWLETAGFASTRAASVPLALKELGSLTSVDAIVCTPDAAAETLTGSAQVPVIVVAPEPLLPEAVRLVKAGAVNYLAFAAEPESLLEALHEALAATPNGSVQAYSLNGTSPAMRALAEQVQKVGPTESTVLISGETGTGKELVARALHSASRRHLAPLISANCATIPQQLIEAEIFGDNRAGGRRSLLEAAQGGTLFLDEIGELPLAAQGRLLRQLEHASVNVRLIAATQRDLEQLIERDQFRKDLYYRLKVVSLTIPPLRDRGDDIVHVAQGLLQKTAKRLGKTVPEFSDEALDAMRRYRWPGNVRELENAIERAVILGEGEPITSSLLAIEPEPPTRGTSRTQPPDQTMEDYFVSFVTAHQDSLTETELAERLGISRKSLWERRQRLNIPRKKTRKRGPRRDVN